MAEVKAKTIHYREVTIDVTVSLEDIFELAAIDDYGPEWKASLKISGHTYVLDNRPDLQFNLKRWVSTEG